MKTNKFIQMFEEKQMHDKTPALRTGDIVTVNSWIIEGGKQRLQTFQGFILAKRNRGLCSSVTVRRVSKGFGVEKTFPIHSKRIDSIVVKKHSQVRKAKLYYMRKLSGKSARIKERI